MTPPRNALLARRSLLHAALGLAAVGGALAACSGEAAPRQGGGAGGAGGAGLRTVSSRTPRSDGDAAAIADVASAVQRFGGALFAQVAGGPGQGNLAVSPSSVAVALGMTMAGASGATFEEMARLLGAAGGPDRWHRGLNALRTHLDGIAGPQQRPDGTSADVVLRSADQIFAQRDIAWADAFVDLLAREYGAGLIEVDLAGDAERSRALINDWVAERTDRIITDLLPEGAIHADSRMVLVDALRLVAPWRTPFEPTSTQPAPFRRFDGGVVQAPTMRHSALSARLVDGEGWRAVRIPYVGDGLTMTVVLPGGDPRQGTALQALVARQGLGVLLDDPGREQSVDLRLPRWTTRSSVELGPALEALGIGLAFTGRADFSGMTTQERLAIDRVLHQGYVSVDEAGTEAAAATAVTMTRLSAPVSVPFVVDRPFLYVVHDTEHGVPLFVGQVLDPSE